MVNFSRYLKQAQRQQSFFSIIIVVFFYEQGHSQLHDKLTIFVHCTDRRNSDLSESLAIMSGSEVEASVTGTLDFNL
jgi:hypothetical protein